MGKNSHSYLGRIKGGEMMTRVTGVLIDTVSIQKYVFASNKLKDNLGASYLVESIYKDYMSQALERTLGQEVDLEDWSINPERLSVLAGGLFDVGYIGGGNALLFFKEAFHAREFIKNWTRDLLILTPSLNTAIALNENFDMGPGFQSSLKVLFDSLVVNKNTYFPNTVFSKYGFTQDCNLSGLSAEVFSRGVNQGDGHYISYASKAKLEAAEGAQKKTSRDFAHVLKGEYTFSDELGKLGQRVGESHIAVVHIDGNSMSDRFKECKDLKARRELSRSVNKRTREAFGDLLKYIVDREEYFTLEKGFVISTDKGRKVLPIRPIVLNGDDITFVTDGRLGVPFAEKFMEYLSSEPLADGKILEACAGVAIVKTKYPFYRAYTLSEELCAACKTVAREKGFGSWLDFYTSFGGISGGLSEIREKHYKVRAGDLHFGPYLISKVSEDEKSLYHLKKGIASLNTQEWPRSKVKAFRSVLPLGPDATAKFVQELNKELPDTIKIRNFRGDGWESSTTPFMDRLELLEFYPKQFLEE